PCETRTPKFSVPPLRERLDELPGAVAKLLAGNDKDRTWDADFIEALACHPFPLNFAELAAASRSVAQTPSPIGIAALPHAIRAQELGIQRAQLYRLLAGLGLNPDLYRGLSSPPDATARPREERRTLT